MTKEYRLLLALGNVDPTLLAESEHPPKRRSYRPWLTTGIAAALCLAVGLSLLQGQHSGTNNAGDSNMDSDIPQSDIDQTKEEPLISIEDLPTQNESGGSYHYLTYGATRDIRSHIPPFRLYINYESYTAYTESDRYVISPRHMSSNALPPCEMVISHQTNMTARDAALALQNQWMSLYPTVTEPQSSSAPVGVFLSASTGITWDSQVYDVWFLEDGQGGVFTLSATYFMEAAEGHGVKFANMASTFQVIDPYEELWQRELCETVETLLPAIFSNDLAPVSDLLTVDAEINGYDEDVSPDVSISSIDYTVEGDHATAEVQHLWSTEQVGRSLTIRLICRDGRWLAYQAELCR